VFATRTCIKAVLFSSSLLVGIKFSIVWTRNKSTHREENAVFLWNDSHFCHTLPMSMNRTKIRDGRLWSNRYFKIYFLTLVMAIQEKVLRAVESISNFSYNWCTEMKNGIISGVDFLHNALYLQKKLLPQTMYVQGIDQKQNRGWKMICSESRKCFWGVFREIWLAETHRVIEVAIWTLFAAKWLARVYKKRLAVCVLNFVWIVFIWSDFVWVLELPTNWTAAAHIELNSLAKVTYPSTSRLILPLVCKKVSLSTYILNFVWFKFRFL